jgi:hypothetical protein
MDFVAERGQLDAQLGSDDSGTAVCGVTSDSDAHEAFLIRFYRYVMDVWDAEDDAGNQRTELANRRLARWQVSKSGGHTR